MQRKVNIKNKRARFEYELIDQYTAGIVLTGTEIKSIRSSKASISESFCDFNDLGELFSNTRVRELLCQCTASSPVRKIYFECDGPML